jgi:membrane protease YdiL (CAAX protease family)
MTLHIARTHARTLFPHVLALMADGRLHPEAVTTTVASLDNAPSNLHDHPTGDSAKDNPDRLTGPCPPAHALLAGIAAGALAGFCEELGWTGFAYPRMRARFGWLPAALLLGVLWGLWHLPVVDSLRAASPHGRYWPEYFAAFIAVLAAIRVLIAWTYVHTGSLRMAQLLHASSTGFLVILSAPRAAPAQEAFWYFLYAAALWANCHHRRLAPAQAGSRPPPRSLPVVGVARRWTREIRSGRAGGRRRLAADPNRSIVMARWGSQGAPLSLLPRAWRRARRSAAVVKITGRQVIPVVFPGRGARSCPPVGRPARGPGSRRWRPRC